MSAPFLRAAMLLLTLTVVLLPSTSGCESSEPRSWARIVTDRSQLVGGDRSLGEVGDFLLENDQIRLVIQRPGFSRGFGVYGGSLIDADLRRPSEVGSSGEPSGFDQFGELFPAFFIQATAVDTVEILDDGSDGGPARIEASGKAGDFLELVAVFNRIVTGSNVDFQNGNSPPRLRYSTIYELEPGKRYVTTRFRVRNVTQEAISFPGPDAELFGLLGLSLEGFTIPVGDIALFGATSRIFMPGVGFDLRFGLERAYARGIDFPAFPGFVTEYVASRGSHTSYGLIAGESDRNYAYNKRDIYDDGRTPITRSSILVPFVASAFIGCFFEDAPPSLGPGESFEVVKHFIVGTGDVGSVLDTIHEIRGAETGRLGVQVVDAEVGTPADGTMGIVYQRLADGTDRPFVQYDVRDGGFFTGTLEPGAYRLKVVGEGRLSTTPVDFDISTGETTSLLVQSPPPGRIVVDVLDETGQPLPAKATAIGRFAAKFAGQPTPSFLFDLAAGEHFRTSDLVTDDPNEPATRSFVEATASTDRGVAELLVRPGSYEVISSRGPEYEARRTVVTVEAGDTVSVKHTLNRVVDTTGWIAADTHIHSVRSIDSSMTLDERVRAVAAEGVEVAVSTDHNFVTDYAPTIAQNELDGWLRSIIGVEMTTLESGHYNGYPLAYQVGPITHGSFEWARRTPGEIFADLRALGRDPKQTIVQVNHPRDQILGYYSQYERDPLTHAEIPPSAFASLTSPSGPAFKDAAGKTTFSFDYDAVELANGKLFWQIHHYRVPESLPPGELPPVIPPVGSILKDADGEVAYPGAVDDWFNLLNLGYRFIGVGSGDSHSAADEPGQFRTMVYVGDDQPAALDESAFVEALRSRRVVVTNGPLLDFYVNDPTDGAMGRTIVDGDGTVKLTVKLTAAPWMSLARMNIYRNGVIAQAVELDPSRDLAQSPFEQTFELPLSVDASGALADSWFVVEAFGYQSLFPVVLPLELPPVVLTDAVASLAGPLGLGGDELGDLKPREFFPVTAFAITNPVWVTRTSAPFVPSGPVPVEVQDLPENDPRFMAGIYAQSTIASPTSKPLKLETDTTTWKHPNGRRVPMFYPRPGNFADVRKTLSRMGHLGGHTH